MGRIDRRESKRITYICEVECETAGDNRITTRVNDISLTGLFIDSMTSFAVGRVLKLKFRVKDRLIETMGEVRYSMPQVGMGVRFISLNAEQRALIESLVEGKPLVLPEPAAAPEEAMNPAANIGFKRIFRQFRGRQPVRRNSDDRKQPPHGRARGYVACDERRDIFQQRPDSRREIRDGLQPRCAE